MHSQHRVRGIVNIIEGMKEVWLIADWQEWEWETEKVGYYSTFIVSWSFFLLNMQDWEIPEHMYMPQASD